MGARRLCAWVSAAALLLSLSVAACAARITPRTAALLPRPTPSAPPEEDAVPALNLLVGAASYTVTLEDNETTRALLERLPLSITMDELNGNEKFHYLDGNLPTDAANPGHIQSGDLMLYGSNCLVLFYESFPTSYRYTPLGRVDNPQGLADALGEGGVEVILQTQ